jgi:hypothetical protein
VTEAQGFLFSRPVPAMRIRELLKASHGRLIRSGAPALMTSKPVVRSRDAG